MVLAKKGLCQIFTPRHWALMVDGEWSCDSEQSIAMEIAISMTMCFSIMCTHVMLPYIYDTGISIDCEFGWL